MEKLAGLLLQATLTTQPKATLTTTTPNPLENHPPPPQPTALHPPSTPQSIEHKLGCPL
ncbi:unnamed protein product [Prunus armeniaca]|uniref:Uncharacterized protein n=1 Tax=Prunus armeniaca TaxID=36596 RepID=A0A6J5WU79_PRUAR|nr:unnamed protein product [Prunus armeniaca]CAB4303627.1 unnamed protein product [Prunus armeniaca]